jgi:hypothetical protein
VERVGVGTGDVTRPPALQLALALAVEEAKAEAEEDLMRPIRLPIVGVGVCVPLMLPMDGRDFEGGGPIKPFVDEFKFEFDAEEEIEGVTLTRLLFPSATFDTLSFEFFFTKPVLLASSDDIAEGGREIPNGVAVNESLRCDDLADEGAGVLPPVPRTFSFLLICNKNISTSTPFSW